MATDDPCPASCELTSAITTYPPLPDLSYQSLRDCHARRRACFTRSSPSPTRRRPIRPGAAGSAMKYCSLMIIRLNSDKCLSLDSISLRGHSAPFLAAITVVEQRYIQLVSSARHSGLPGVNARPRIRPTRHGEVVVTIRRSSERQLAAGSGLPAHRQGAPIEVGTAPTVDGLAGSIANRAGRVEVTGVVGERDGIGTSAARAAGVECRSHIASRGHGQRAGARPRACPTPPGES